MIVVILACLSLALAQDTKGPACTAVCGANPCAGKTGAERTACGKDCLQKGSACLQEQIDAAKSKFKAQFDDAKTQLTTRVDEWKTKLGAWRNASVDDLKTGCLGVCSNKMDVLGDKYADCMAKCNSITDFATGIQAMANFLLTTLRAKVDALQLQFPNETAKVATAYDALRDAIGIQRNLVANGRQALLTALDSKKAAVADARAARDKARDDAKAAVEDFKARLAAATTDEEKRQIRADGKAALQTAVSDAKSKWQTLKANWIAAKQAAVDKIVAYVKQRKTNRRIIIADVADLKIALVDLKAAVQQADASAEVVAGGTKKRAMTAVVVASCETTDATCDLMLNTALAGSVDSADAVTINESTADELDWTEPSVDQLTADTNTNTKANNNAAASLVVAAVAVVVAIVAAL